MKNEHVAKQTLADTINRRYQTVLAAPGVNGITLIADDHVRLAEYLIEMRAGKFLKPVLVYASTSFNYLQKPETVKLTRHELRQITLLTAEFNDNDFEQLTLELFNKC